VYSICTGVNFTTGIIVEPSLRHYQYLEALIAPLPSEKNKIIILKSSLRHFLQIPNLPTSVCSERKAADRAVCTAGNLFANSQHLYKMAL
jgi:hypothetical protein